MKYKIYIMLVLILFFNLMPVKAANYGGELNIKVELRPFNLNPIYAANETEMMITEQIFDTLVTYNQQEEITANLVESWEVNRDSTIFRFKLKEDIYFHPYNSGNKKLPLKMREVTAADWKWSFEYLSDPKNKSPYADLFDKVKGFTEYRQGKNREIEGIRVKDKYQLEIELGESYAPFIYNLARKAAVVMPAEAVMNSDLNFSTAPVGTGPFMYHEFSNNKVELIKNINFWKNNFQKEKEPYLDQLKFDFDESNSLALNLNEFDLYQLKPTEIPEAQQANLSNYQFKNLLKNNIYFLGINYKSDLIANYSNNYFQKSLNSILSDKIDENLNCRYYISPADEPDRQDFLKDLSTNLQGGKDIDAKEISSDIKLAINDSSINLKIAEKIKDLLETENIKLKIEKYSWTEYINGLKNRSLDEDLFMMSADYNNLYEFIYNNFYSTSNSNYFSYQNDRLDNLLDYLRLVNSEQYVEQAFDISKKIIIEDNPFIFLLQETDPYLVSDRLVSQNIFENYNQKYDFEKIYFE